MTTERSMITHWKDLVKVFLKLGAMSYGGPAIMGIMQAEIQEKRDWLSKEKFLEGLALVSMLPGAGATQLGIFVGYHRAGWWGGVVAGLCFILPAFFIMLVLTLLYSAYGALPVMRDAFCGLTGAIVGGLAIFLPSFILMLSVLPVLARFRDLQWIKAAMRGISAGVIGALAVSLWQMAPHAAPDDFTLFLMILTVAAMLWWRIGPLPLMLGGSYIRATSRLNPLQRLKELT